MPFPWEGESRVVKQECAGWYEECLFRLLTSLHKKLTLSPSRSIGDVRVASPKPLPLERPAAGATLRK